MMHNHSSSGTTVHNSLAMAIEGKLDVRFHCVCCFLLVFSYMQLVNKDMPFPLSFCLKRNNDFLDYE